MMTGSQVRAIDTEDGPAGLPGLPSAREATFLTQAELAGVVGLNRSTISELAAGARNGHLRTIQRLAAALNVEPQELLVAPPRARWRGTRVKEVVAESLR